MASRVPGSAIASRVPESAVAARVPLEAPRISILDQPPGRLLPDGYFMAQDAPVGGGADVYDPQSRSPSPGVLITEHRHLSPLIKSTSSTHSSCTVIVYSFHSETNIAMCYLPDSPAIVYLLVISVFRSPFSTGLHHFCDPPSPRSIVPTGSPGIGNRT